MSVAPGGPPAELARTLAAPLPDSKKARHDESASVDIGRRLWQSKAVPVEKGPTMPQDAIHPALAARMTPADQTGIPQLLAIMAALRDKDSGCPWDIEQTFATIAPYTIEEAHEVADAIAREAWDELPGELGDLLLQVVFHAQMADEAGLFDFSDVVASVTDKMITRHPHIFGDESRDKSAAQQVRDWEEIKARERAAKAEKGVLDGVALGLPGLMRAVKLQNRAARVGFDWEGPRDVLVKIQEECAELAEAQHTDHAHLTEEFGDLMFAMANLARHLDIDPEAALRGANAKFTRRFRHIETELAAQGRRPEDSDLAEMDALWNDAKAAERAR